jgi:predicted GNAT family acetyltransferase
MSDPIVRKDLDQHRYVAEVDGEVAGFAVFHIRNGRYFFVHTETDPRFEGRGIGSALAKGALDDVRAEGATVVPLCPFIAGWIARHADYEPLVDHELVSHIDGR